MRLISKKDSCYFKQYILEECTYIPHQMPDVEEINSVVLQYEIIAIEEINTPIGISKEGQSLTGKKMMITIKLSKRVTYTSDDECKQIHSFRAESYHRAYIVIPPIISGSTSKILVENKILNPKVTVENVNWQIKNTRCIFNGVAIFIELEMCPTYMLSYSQCNDCKSSYLYIDYECHSKKKCLVCFDDYKIKQVKWSLDGKKIAFIGVSYLQSYLFVLHVESCSMFQLTNSCDFERVLDFYWDENSDKILFTGSYKRKTELYLMDIYSNEYIQLTHSRNKSYSFKPKYSLDSKYISYIRVNNGYSNLYLTLMGNRNEKQLTKCEKIMNYDWISEHEIVYISCENESFYEINLLDIESKETSTIIRLNKSARISKWKVSPNKDYIAFIAEYNNIENIYNLTLSENNIRNITKYEEVVRINDFDWNSNSCEILYSSDELGSYDLYSACICTGEIIKIKDIDSNGVFVSFRPKIL